MFLAEPLTDGFRPMPYAETGTIGGTAPRRFELLDEVPVDAVLCTAGTVEVKLWISSSAPDRMFSGIGCLPTVYVTRMLFAPYQKNRDG